MSRVRFAFVGFRHGHIFSLLKAVKAHDDCEVVACCEEDKATREALPETRDLQPTHDDFGRMLEEVDFDVLSVGDYYAKRGGLMIRALEAGKHILSDKPICTSLDELDRIAELSRSKNLAVGCQLDLRCSGNYRTMRELIHAGEIGEVHTVTFTGQHPLSPGSRPGWYFEDGCHGGTINDIAIHGFDGIPWMTGRRIVEVVSARAWNARCELNRNFQDGAQAMLRLDNNGGVLCDVSYLTPEGCKERLAQYWRFTCHGSTGMVETHYDEDSVLLARRGVAELVRQPAGPDVPHEYLTHFLDELRGSSENDALTTERVLAASKVSLLTQKAADEGLTGVSCE